ncbi:MAG: hydantoinase B/oxoprolinase family protein [Planctomycetota bacterium]
MRPEPLDPVRLEVLHHLLSAFCEEAGALLQRSARSPNIRERRDFSVALFDGRGRLCAQAAHIPVHLGSAADAVQAASEALAWRPGDVAILNDPYAGGTHLPDITMVRPVFSARSGEPIWFLVNRAHHADIGGAAPGSMAISRDLHGEGLVIPPIRMRDRGRLERDVLRLFASNVRGPSERVFDLMAQESCLGLFERRLCDLLRDWGGETVERGASALMDYTERLGRAGLKELEPGTFEAVDRMEDDGAGNEDLEVRLRLSVTRRRLVFDWTGTADQAAGGINCNRSVVLAACAFVLRCLCPDRLPVNDGIFRLFDVRTRRGSLLDPKPPAAVAGGNVETSQRLVDTAFSALRMALPGRIPAASAGTMSNLSLGGQAASGSFSIYETLPGGAGASPDGPGASALQTHMTNTRNTPVEDLERRFPLRVEALTIRRGSGGRGRWRGGDGLRKTLVALCPMTLSFLAERHKLAPEGSAGGGPGRRGALRVRPKSARSPGRKLPSKCTIELRPGDAVIAETPGGGGFGSA